MNKLGIKIDAMNLKSTLVAKTLTVYRRVKTPVHLIVPGVFLMALPSCVMTRAEGNALNSQMRHIEDEVAKLQRVRHEMEVLLKGQVKDLFDRLARLEGQLGSFRESLYEGSNKNGELIAEIANLRGQLEEAQFQYRNLEQDQKNLAQKQQALKQAQSQIIIPPLKKDHYDLAKKFYTAGKFEQSIFLLDEYIKQYSSDKEMTGQSYYLLGEIYRKLAEAAQGSEESEKSYKKSVVSYQKIIELKQPATLREEALFKIGSVLKAMGNKDGAKAAFNELISNHKNSKRAAEAKKQLASLNAPD